MRIINLLISKNYSSEGVYELEEYDENAIKDDEGVGEALPVERLEIGFALPPHVASR